MICPYEKCKQVFQREKALHHYKSECEEVQYQCPTCEELLVKRDQQGHNCFKVLKLHIADQDKTIRMLTERFDQMSTQMNDMQKRFGQGMEEQKKAIMQQVSTSLS